MGYINDKDDPNVTQGPAVFQPTKVRVEDRDGKPIKEYIVIGKKPIIVLPPDDEVPDPEDPENEQFAGWEQPGKGDITPGHTPEPDDDNTIVIRPTYSSDQAKMVYLANGGTIVDRYGKEVPDKYSFDVMSGASVMKKMDDHYITAKKKGNSFAGWKLLKTDQLPADLSNIPDSDLEEIAKQVAKVEKTADGTITRDTYYLVATWQEGKYTLRLDPNGGFSGTVSKYADVPYDTTIAAGVTLTETGAIKTLPAGDRQAPSRNGHFFAGWSTEPLKVVKTPAELQGKLIMASSAYNSTITNLAPAPKMGDGDMKLYAAWILDTSMTVFTFDSNGGTSVNDQAYTSGESEYAAFQTPSRPGYVFEGWYEKTGEEADGTPITSATKVGGEGSPLKLEGGTLDASVKGKQYTFVAKWSPGQETPYTVEYYVNSGNKDRNGNYIYTKVDHERPDGTPYTITRKGITEQTVSIQSSDVLPELSFHGHDYWHNPNSTRVEVTGEGDDAVTKTVPNNITSGVVTGTPHLALKLYYDRYLGINGVKALDSTGDGTVTSVTGQKEGSKPTVTWKAAEGSYVERVVVNGEVRDDLLRAGSFTPEDGLFANTTVRVKFGKGEDPKGTPGESTPTGPRVEPKAYSVNTTVRGCTTSYNGCSVTPTQVYKAGSDVTITFNGPCKNCKILRVEVDGRKVNVTGNSVNFKQLSADHNVDVYVAPKTAPSLGGKDTEGVYSITVNRYGGDSAYSTSGSRTIRMEDANDPDSDWTFQWDRGSSKHRIYSIKVDGLAYRGLIDTRIEDTGKIDLLKGKNHVVDVYFYDIETDPATPNEPEYVEPDFSRPDQWVSVTTEIVGGAGEIDPGFTAKKEKEGEEYEVNYALKNKTNYVDVDYMFYELEKIEVNNKQLSEGEYVTTPDGDGNVKVTLRPTTDDAHVKVTVKPVAVNVDTMTMTLKKQDVLGPDNNPVQDPDNPGTNLKETVLGNPTEGGTISSSKTVGKYGSYTTINAIPNSKAGFKLVAFERVDLTDPSKNESLVLNDDGSWVRKPVSELTALTPATFDLRTEEEPPANEVLSPDEATKAPEADQADEAVFADPAVGNDAPAADDAAVKADEEKPEADADNASDEPAADADEGTNEADDEATDEPADEAEVVEPDPTPTTTPEEAAAAAAPMALLSLAPQDSVPLYEDAVSTPAADAGLFPIEKAYAAEGENGPGKAENVFKTPQTHDDGSATVGYANLTEDQRVIAYFAANDVNQADTEDIIKTREEKSFPVTVTFEGAGDLGGTYTGAGMVAADGTTTVTFGDWPTGYKYDKVNVDGKAEPTAVTDTADGKKQITLNNVQGPVDVKVQLAKKAKDEDPDRHPETPVEKTGYEPRYRVTAMVEGYGGLVISRNPSSATVVAGSKNAKNYELSWEPKDLKETVPGSNTNIPYITSFKVNGVEDPSKIGPVDAKGTYTIPNVDKDYQIKIKTVLLNEDVDGDGDPDYNIDDDGDGKPDRNVDTDGDGLPDTDVDTDDDGKPDVNIDTDDDGKPDVNIYDEDLDGTPDNVDPKGTNPPKPNVNVDTDGDGKPDLNVDTDGDGKPDVDIVDEDGDGKPDQIDPNSPNPPKPNVNVDTDGDGKPDLNVTVDDDYIPDVNIDTNKDGYSDVNVDTNGDYKPEINIDTDNTGTWRPSAEGGNKDKIWKPDTNIDGGDGKGPIHSDNSAPIDSNHDGVDDRWKPTKIMTADNGFKYGTTAEKWYNDVKPGSPASTSPVKDDKLGKSLPQTGDESDLAIAFTGMLAYTALLVCLFARRKMAQEAAQQLVVRRR